jgi:hypothetical protein
MACIMKQVADVIYPLPLVFYETFETEEARRLVERFEFHSGSKQGNWLNMAEIESGIFVRQCLNRRLPDLKTLEQEV